MTANRFRIVTLRPGIEVEVVARPTRAQAEEASKTAVAKAQKAADRQKMPHRVELSDGANVVVAADVTVCR